MKLKFLFFSLLLTLSVSTFAWDCSRCVNWWQSWACIGAYPSGGTSCHIQNDPDFGQTCFTLGSCGGSVGPGPPGGTEGTSGGSKYASSVPETCSSGDVTALIDEDRLSDLKAAYPLLIRILGAVRVSPGVYLLNENFEGIIAENTPGGIQPDVIFVTGNLAESIDGQWEAVVIAENRSATNQIEFSLVPASNFMAGDIRRYDIQNIVVRETTKW